MHRRRIKQSRRLRKLIVLSSFTAVLIMVSTYAWFIGMRTVSVSSFDVEIATTESLLLSIDGKKWDRTVSISQGDLDKDSYVGHTNSWGGEGLIPMSTVGAMDNNASRMILFEKASLTTTTGGFRLMSSRVDNTLEEKDGYVVFDLFIKNISGSQYLENYNALDEEAIYLTVDSEVKVGSAGVENTGIENSVRVAFTQIGRVIGTETNPNKITSISCNADGNGNPSVVDGVTGICRAAQIWEPNDIFHVQNAIRWYESSCIARKETGTYVADPGSYGGLCGTVVNGVGYPTYAVSGKIESSHNIDIYDGAAYNGYTKSSPLLTDFKYFTDTMKEFEGVQRPTFMTLAPNSITKVRIYIYIEGQDIDNYDYASIGKQIEVKFGFTKERFIEKDIEYDGPDLNPNSTDTERPVITLLGDPEVVIARGATYIDAGATAEDNEDGIITNKIRVTNPVDTSKPGTYIVAYDVLDWAGNYAIRVTRTVIVTE